MACGTGIVARTAADRVGGPTVGRRRSQRGHVDRRPPRPPGPRLASGRRRRPPVRGRLVRHRRCARWPSCSSPTASAVAGDGPRRRARRHRRRPRSERASTPNRPTDRSSTWPAGHAGPEARSLLSTYFACGDLDDLAGLFERRRSSVTPTTTHLGTARFPSVDALVTPRWTAPHWASASTAEVRERIRRRRPATSSHRSRPPTAASTRPSKSTSSSPSGPDPIWWALESRAVQPPRLLGLSRGRGRGPATRGPRAPGPPVGS